MFFLKIFVGYPNIPLFFLRSQRYRNERSITAFLTQTLIQNIQHLNISGKLSMAIVALLTYDLQCQIFYNCTEKSQQ